MPRQQQQTVTGQAPTVASNRSGATSQPDVIAAARSSIGVPYRFGGTSPETGFDCSGLVCWTYEQVGISLPRRASEQIAFGNRVDRKEDLQPGDIVVFKGTRGRTGWHSGIYTGDGYFVHSPSTGKTVTESRMDEEYYARRFAGARRIPRDGSAESMLAAFNARQLADNKDAREPVTLASSKSGRSAKKSSRASVLASAKSSGKASGKMSGKMTAKASAKNSGKMTAKAASKATGKMSGKTSGKTIVKAASKGSGKVAVGAPADRHGKAEAAHASDKHKTGKEHGKSLQVAALDHRADSKKTTSKSK